MRHRRSVVFTLLAIMLVGLLPFANPAHADIVPVPFIEVGPEELPPVLSEGEAEYIKLLQRQEVRYQFLSDVSPDGATVLVLAAQLNGAEDSEPAVGFLNILDGSFVQAPTDLLFLLQLGYTNFEWINSETLVTVGFDLSDLFTILLGGSAEEVSFVALLVNRSSGEVEERDLGALPGLPISLSPDARKLLLAVVNESDSTVTSASDIFNVAYQVTPPQVRGFRQPNELPTVEWQRAQGTLQASSSEISLSWLDYTSGVFLPLTTLPEGSIPFDFSWSQDGFNVAVTSINFPGAARGEATLGSVVTQDTLGNIPPDQNPLFQSNQVQTFQIRESGVRQMTLRATDGNGDLFMGATWSPDGSTLLTTMAQPPRLNGRQHPIYTPQFLERYYARFYDAATMQQTGELTAETIQAPFNVDYATPDELYFTAVSGLTERITYFNRASGEVRDITPTPGSFTDPILTVSAPIAVPALRQLVFIHSSFTQPYEIFRLNWEGGGLTQITALNEPLRQLNRIQVQEVSFTLSQGQVRQAYLIQPAGAPFPPQQARIVMWQEGGPTGAIYNQWATNIEKPYNLLPNLGISLLIVPLPGRYGWGPGFNNALADSTNFGQIDIDESAEIAAQLVNTGWAAPGAVGITGCSYGGYFTSQSIGRHPNTYGAAVTMCTLLDNYTEWQTGFQGLMSYLIGSTPAQNPAEYAQDSPLYIANNVRTPTLIFHGSQDFLAVNIAETYHQTLQDTGIPVRMFRFEEEGHGLAGRANQAYAAQIMIDWFRTYLPGN